MQARRNTPTEPSENQSIPFETEQKHPHISMLHLFRPSLTRKENTTHTRMASDGSAPDSAHLRAAARLSTSSAGEQQQGIKATAVGWVWAKKKPSHSW